VAAPAAAPGAASASTARAPKRGLVARHTCLSAPPQMAQAAVDAGSGVAAHLLRVFQEFDTDGNGRIDASELRAMMERVGLSMTRDEAAEVLAEMDDICQGLLATATQGDDEEAAAAAENNFEEDGEINFEEFYAVLMKLEGARAYSANSLGAAASGGGGGGGDNSTKLTIRSIAGTIDQLRARTDQKKRWRAKQAGSQTLQDVRTAAPSEKLDEDKKREIEEMLDAVPLLATLAPPAKAQLLDLLSVRKFKKGQDIVRRGDEGNEFFLILKGRVQILSETEDVIVELEAGKHFGERSLIISEPRNATVRCAVECEVASVHRVGFTQILDRIGGKERERRRRLAQRRQVERRREERTKAKAERAKARDRAGRKRPTGRLRRFSAIDDWSATMEQEAQERARGAKANGNTTAGSDAEMGSDDDEGGQTRAALSGVKRRVRRASVEVFDKINKMKEVLSTSSASSPRAGRGGAGSDSSEDEFDAPPASDEDDDSPRTPRARDNGGAGDSSPTARALSGVKRRVRRASVTVMGTLSKIKQTISNSPSQKESPKDSSSEDGSDEEEPPPAKDLLKSTMAELDALLGEQAVRHEPAKRGWERAVAARKPAQATTPANPKPGQLGLALPLLDRSTGSQQEDATPFGVPPAAAMRRRRGGVGAAGQSIMTQTGMMVGVARTLEGTTSAKRKTVRALPSLELRDARDRRVRAAKFRSRRATKALAPTPLAPAQGKCGYLWSPAEIDQWVDSQTG
jgi:CRP-like cAMP-binding protein